MRKFRQQRDKTVREQIEAFTYDVTDEDGKTRKKKSIIDSSQLHGARVIKKYL